MMDVAGQRTLVRVVIAAGFALGLCLGVNWRSALAGDESVGLEAVFDRTLQPIDGPDGYQRREGRAEGLFIQAVSAVHIDLVSYVSGDLNFTETDKVLPLRIPSRARTRFPAQLIAVKAVSVQLGSFYRLDAPLTGTTTTFDWRLDDVVRGQNLTPDKLGVFALVTPSETEEPVFIPLRAGATPSNAVSRLRALIRVPFDAELVSWRITGSSGWQRLGPRMMGQIAEVEVPAAQTDAEEMIDLTVLARPGVGSADRIRRFRLFRANAKQ